MKHHEYLEQKRKEAEQRFNSRAMRTPKMQLDRLDTAFGKNQGAVKERIKLHNQIKEMSAKNKE